MQNGKDPWQYKSNEHGHIQQTFNPVPVDDPFIKLDDRTKISQVRRLNVSLVFYTLGILA